MPATTTSRAYIVLHVDSITKGWNGWYANWPIVCYLPANDVLYHEIGHHIDAAHRPVYQGKEDVAESWRRKLWARFVRRRYWYLFPALYVLGRALRLFEKLRA